MTPLISIRQSPAVNAFHCICQQDNVDRGGGVGVCRRTEKHICRNCCRWIVPSNTAHIFITGLIWLTAFPCTVFFLKGWGAVRTRMLRSRVKVTVPAWPNLSLLQPEEPSPEMEALLSQPPPPLLLLGESASQEIHLHRVDKSEIAHQTTGKECAFACEAVSGTARVANPLHSLRVTITLQPEEKKTTQLVFWPSWSVLMALWLS